MRNQLKIAFIVRSTINQVQGGDSMQVFNTAKELRKLGVQVDIKKSNEKINYQHYDLLHLFNIIRPADHLLHIKSGVPYVISTIYLDYSDFDTQGRFGWQKQLFSFLGKDKSEFFKNNIRFSKGQDKLASIEYMLGHKRALKKVLLGARLILPNSISEYHRLINDYGISKSFHVVPNGINPDLFHILPETKRIENQIICVGQIYGLKNQHQLIEATHGMDVKLIFIGKPPPNHHSYAQYCKKIASPNVEFYDFMPQEQLAEYYAQSKVHALPSWFETTGLSSLEAGAMGCNLVVGSGGDTQHYFSNHATFCHANDIESIRTAIEIALKKRTTFEFRDFILDNYTWEQAAIETIIGYKKALQID
jgi:glycosyltransferase involved in cell wall biosynthesis